MSLVKVKSIYQVVIPEDVRKKLKVEIGDVLKIEEKNGKLIIKPVVVVDKAQAYFWTKGWQAGEREADEDIEKGRLSGPFKSAKELISHLRKSGRKGL